jgi:hypothetical protein
MTKYRKAIAAFIVPFLGLPLAGWISGEVEFTPSVLAGAVVAAISGLATYFFPNEPEQLTIKFTSDDI